MAKNKGFGQAEIFSNTDYSKLYDAINNSTHLLILSLLRYTGERVGAVVQLGVMDVYRNPFISEPRQTILYKAYTRKQAGGVVADTHEVPVSRALHNELARYKPPKYGYLFPSPRDESRHVTTSNCDKWFRRGLRKAGLNRRGFSLHSPRRTLATRLSEEGVPLQTIRSITGHKTLSSLQRYIDVEDRSKKAAVELL
jgi:integrase/recombinase XerD